jgi:dihydroorotase
VTELLVIKNVRVVDPSRNLDETADVVVENGRLTRLGRGAAEGLAAASRARVVDGTGRWLLPAFVDQHVHLREPGFEYKEDIASGLAAAAAGGYSRVCAMPNTRPVNDTRAITDFMLAQAARAASEGIPAGRGGARLHPIAAITRGLEGKQLTEMGELKEAGAVGVSDDGRCVTSSSVMLRALQYAKNFDLVVIQHAEDHDLTHGADMHEGEVSARLGLRGWPRVAEDIIVARDILLAEYTGARYHVAHASTAGAARFVREAKSRGLPVTCEVTPHHLLLTDAAVMAGGLGYDTSCKVNPPLREAADLEALIDALADGTIDSIATDHAPHSPLEKDCEFSEASHGLIGLELCFPLMLDLVRKERLKLGRLVDALTARPAKIMGLEAPSLSEGRLAEFTLVDPELEWTASRSTLRTKSTNTPFLHRALRGKVLLTLIEGRIAFDLLGGEA